MIKGIHGMFFTDQAEELRAFIKDKLALRQTKWVLQSLVDVGGVGYTCSSISGSVDVYNCAVEACRGLRAAE